MKINWTIEADDIRLIQDFIELQSDNSFVINRFHKNVNGNAPHIDQERFWKAMISCLITTQQRSGPESSVTRFIRTNPFPLNFAKCQEHHESLDDFVETTITNFGRLRRAKNIGKEVDHNFCWLVSSDGWRIIEERIEELKDCRNRTPQFADVVIERNAARFISKNMKGFGPKQSRNLWQLLGLTRYEIPIDSRITKWLNRNKFPLKLSANALSDSNYYAFIMDGIQILCEKSESYPCILDASIFASFDQEWREEELIW